MGRSSVAVRSTEKKEITLRELENLETSAVYVINSSPRSHRGEIIFSVPRPNGVGEDVIRVPKTWIPVDLSDQVEKKNLMQSSRFRLNVSKKLLTLIHPDVAERVLEGEDATAEKERLDNLRSAATALMRSAPTTGRNNDDDDDDEPQTPTQRRRKAMLKQQEDSNAQDPVVKGGDVVTSAFDVLLQSLEGKRQDAVLNALRSEGSLSRKELKKVISKFGDMDKVTKWAEKKLEK
jgi:hypothetical protein